MKVQITSVPALIHWLSKAFRLLNVLETDETTESISMTDDPRDFIARIEVVVRDLGNDEVQGELLRPVIDFKEPIERMLNSLKDGDRHTNDKQRIRQNKLRVRDQVIGKLLIHSRFFYDSLKYQHDIHNNPEAGLIIGGLVRPLLHMSPDEILILVEELIEAEQLLVRLGYNAVANPTAESLTELIEEAKKALGEAQAASADLVLARRARLQLRDEGRRLVRRIARYLDFFYKELPEEQKRVIERELGYFFEPKRREAEKPETEDEEANIEEASEPTDTTNEEPPTTTPKTNTTTTTNTTIDEQNTEDSTNPTKPYPTILKSEKEVPPDRIAWKTQDVLRGGPRALPTANHLQSVAKDTLLN